MYLKEPQIGVEADPLQWWKLNSVQFPNISREQKCSLELLLHFQPVDGSSQNTGHN